MSVRHDLLALTSADLADISNRGNVKRATKELDEQKVTYELHDDHGTITVTWSDGPVSVLPAGKTVANASCDCHATGICRHLIRAVLAYQALHTTESSTPAAPTGPWNPGDITDTTLGELFTARMLTALRSTYDGGLVVELLRSSKPVARFHTLRHTVRFLVPGDARYSQCDCAEKAPCRHAALAVWAFRELGDAGARIVTTGASEPRVDAALLNDAEVALRKIVEAGIANTASTTMDRLRATETRLRQANIVWPAEILLDVRRQYDHYHAHDARFSPDTLADLLGEFVIRLDALRRDDLPVPTLFVRGQQDDQEAKLGQSRLVGLGCAVRNHQKSVEILALMQDDSSGTIAAVTRHFPAPTDEAEPEDFARLGSKLVVKGRDLTTIGAGQLVIKTGKLYADHRLSLGRSTASVYAQNYAWEELRAPVHAENFDEVRARLAQLPPASLRPRRLGEDLHAVRIHDVEHVRFSARDQAVRATLRDANGVPAQLFHPYSTRNRHGTERLLNWLTRSAAELLFVAGPFRLGAAGLIVSPTGLVFDAAGIRMLVQPWVDDMDAYLESSDVAIEPPDGTQRPLDNLRGGVAAALGDAILSGIESAITHHDDWARWESLAAALHLSSLARSIDVLRTSIAAADHRAISDALLELAALSRLSQELG